MKSKYLAVAGVALLALTACGGGTSTPTTTQGATQAPKEEAVEKAPAANPNDMVITGNTAGMNFEVVSDADKEKSLQAGQGMIKNAKIEPAECKQLYDMSASMGDTGAGLATATSGQTAYVAGVSKAMNSTKQAKAVAQKCGNITIDMGGMKVAAKSTVTDKNVPGAKEVILQTVSTEVAGQSAKTLTMAGIVRGTYVSAISMGGQPDEAKLAEVFKAQADKVTQAK
ncbi:hypothetical protein GCM10027418_25210 [Mariniluteicoccus endophyticus]